MNSAATNEVAFTMDTTGSMYQCINAVRRRIEESGTKLFKEIPNLRIGIGAHGDYCDKRTTYVTQWSDLSPRLHDLVQFVRNARDTGGGDAEECYELMLREAQKLDWSHKANKALIIVGDEIPHPVSNRENIAHNGTGIDWRKEVEKLREMGIVVHTIQCLNKRHATPFYRELAAITGGYHLTLDQFSEVTDLLMALCIQQGNPEGLQRFEEEVIKAGRMSRSLDASLATIGKRPVAERFVRAPKSLDAVPAGRFQTMLVDRGDTDGKVQIKDFVQANGLIFKTGKGFYQFTKPELIQGDKEVVLRDKRTGDMYSGAKAREMIGLAVGERAKLKPVFLSDYDVFVQSNSYNRNLVVGTQFLYEVDMSR